MKLYLVDIYVGYGNNDPGGKPEVVLQLAFGNSNHRINLTDAQVDKMLYEIGKYKAQGPKQRDATGRGCHRDCACLPGHLSSCLDPMGNSL